MVRKLDDKVDKLAREHATKCAKDSYDQTFAREFRPPILNYKEKELRTPEEQEIIGPLYFEAERKARLASNETYKVAYDIAANIIGQPLDKDKF